MKKWRIKRIDELDDDELDEFYCTLDNLWGRGFKLESLNSNNK